MPFKTKITNALIAILLILLTPANAVAAQENNQEYIGGFWVRGEFLHFYNNTPDARLLFGDPISQEFISADGKRVQYFENVRMEFDSNALPGLEVRLTPVGTELKRVQQADGQINLNNALGCEIYDKYPVCFAFLKFYEQHGGPALLGYPITPFEFHGTLIVQYFQNVRLEWNPRNPSGQRVVISSLGRNYFELLKEDSEYLRKENNGGAGRVVDPVSLEVRVFPWKAVSHNNDTQKIFVIVRDQNDNAIPGATIDCTISWPSGKIEKLSKTSTHNGVVIFDVNVTGQPAGKEVYVTILVQFNEEEVATQTSFRIWH